MNPCDGESIIPTPVPVQPLMNSTTAVPHRQPSFQHHTPTRTLSITRGSRMSPTTPQTTNLAHDTTATPVKRHRHRRHGRRHLPTEKSWVVPCWCSCAKAPNTCLYTTLCPWCSVAEQRVQMMKSDRKGLRDYKCLALMYPEPLFCAGDVCDEESKKPLKRECSGGCLLCWEVLFCMPCAVHGNRFFIAQRYGLAREAWEKLLERCPIPYFMLDCCTTPCLPCIITQQVMQTTYETKHGIGGGGGLYYLNRQSPGLEGFQGTISHGFHTPAETSSCSSDTFDHSFCTAMSDPESSDEEDGEGVNPDADGGAASGLDEADKKEKDEQLKESRLTRRLSALYRCFHFISAANYDFLINGCYTVLDTQQDFEGIPGVVFMSKTFLEMIGYEELEIVGKPYSVLFGSNTNPMCVRQMQRLIQTREEGFVVLMLQRKDGTPFTNVMFLTSYTPPHVRSEDQQNRYILCFQCDSGDETTRLMLRALPPNPAHSKSRVMILYDGQTFVPNVGPGKVTSPHFDGMFYLKTLTDPPDQRVAAYFEGRRRRFELQIQGEFKTPVDGEIFLNLYLEEKLTLGFATRAILRLMIAGVRKRSKGSAITVGDEMPGGKPAMALPLGSSLDRFIVSDNASEVPAPNIAIDMFPEP
eukprot:PhF_6_TR40829/c0_g2_i6/m.61814